MAGKANPTQRKGETKMKTYTVVTGDGNELCDGASAYEIERVAQGWADHLGQTVYYGESGGADLDPDDDEDIGTAVHPRTEIHDG